MALLLSLSSFVVRLLLVGLLSSLHLSLLPVSSSSAVSVALTGAGEAIAAASISRVSGHQRENGDSTERWECSSTDVEVLPCCLSLSVSLSLSLSLSVSLSLSLSLSSPPLSIIKSLSLCDFLFVSFSPLLSLSP